MKINTKKTFFTTFIILLISGLGFYIYTNPQIISKISFKTKENKVNISKDINYLQNQINNLFHNIKQMPDPNTKADINDLNTIKEELSTIQEQINAYSKKTDKNSLILTSAIMLKQEAQQGTPFETQSFLLENLTQNNPTYKQEIETIKNIAPKGILSDAMLINEFNKVYNQSINEQKQAFESSQKSDIKTKLSNFIKITKVNKSKTGFTPNKDLEELKYLVENKNFSQAVYKMQKITQDPLQINEKLNAWKDNINQRQKLYKAINDIVAKSIIAIDVQTLNKEQ